MMTHRWQFPAEYLRNYDGDTVTLMLDMGFKIQQEHDVRLAGVDAPEIKGGTALTKAAARLARDMVCTHLTQPGVSLIFLSSKWAGKYGRPVGEILVNGRRLSAWLIRAHLAVPYNGGARSDHTKHLANCRMLQNSGQLPKVFVRTKMKRAV